MTNQSPAANVFVDYDQQPSNQFSDLTGPARGDKLVEFAGDGAKSRLKTLLQLPVDLEHPETSRTKALHHALRNGETECARLLVDKGANVDARDESGQTPLFISTSQGDHETVLFLLKDGGAKPDISDEKGMTPLMAASSGAHHRIDYAIVDDLLEHKANVQEADDNGWTALHYAAKHGKHRLYGRLLLKSAQIHARGNPEQWVAITLAAAYGDVGLVEQLLSGGANANAEMQDGATAMIVAAHKGHLESVRRLQIGRGYQKRNEMGRTALMWAAWTGHYKVAQMLADCGTAYVRMTSDGAETAADIALKMGNRKLAEMLERKVTEVNESEEAGDIPEAENNKGSRRRGIFRGFKP